MIVGGDRSTGSPPSVPDSIRELVASQPRSLAQESMMRLAIEIGCRSARLGGGPFGAVLANTSGEIIEVGWNNVVIGTDSTAHAEIVCIRRAQRLLRTHSLSKEHPLGPFLMYTSCAPCFQCVGAIYWSGLRVVYSAAGAHHAEAAGFDEGPVTRSLWDTVRDRKGITHVECFCDEDAQRPFTVFKELNGKRY